MRLTGLFVFVFKKFFAKDLVVKEKSIIFAAEFNE
jgi:hypothetical protein